MNRLWQGMKRMFGWKDEIPKSPEHIAIEQDVQESAQERARILQQQKLAREAVNNFLNSQVLVIIRQRDDSESSSS